MTSTATISRPPVSSAVFPPRAVGIDTPKDSGLIAQSNTPAGAGNKDKAQTWVVQAKGPNGRLFKGTLTEINWNTGPGGAKFLFRSGSATHELPPDVKTVEQAARYALQKMTSGAWKEGPPKTQIVPIPDRKGYVRSENRGNITTTELVEKKVFTNGKWATAGFYVPSVARWTNNPVFGGVYSAEVKGYFNSSDKYDIKNTKPISKPDGSPILNLKDAKARVQKQMAAGNYTTVGQMEKTDKLNYMLNVALKNAPEAVATELRALFTPENIAKMVLLGGAYFIPGAGQVAGLVTTVCVGQQAIDVGLKYMAAIYSGLNATTTEELDNSGKAIAQATAQLGVGVGSMLVTAGIAKAVRKTGMPESTISGKQIGKDGRPVTVKTPVKPGSVKLPTLAVALQGAQKTTDNLVVGGTIAGLAYLSAKAARGEVAVAYADKLPGMKNAITTIFNDASADNSVAGAQKQIVVYTTKPGSKEADGYFLANANASVAASKLFNIANITKDIQQGTFNPGGWVDTGKINLIAQNLAAKDQTGGGARATVGSIGSLNVGIYFGIPEINSRFKASVNLMSVNGTMRAMSIGPNGKKQDKTSQVELAKVLAQAYLNFYSAVPDKDDTGKRVGKKPNIGPMQIQINKQLGLPGGAGLQISTVQPSKKEWNAFVNATMPDGTKRKIALESYPKGNATSTEAFSILLNGNKNTNLTLNDVVAVPFSKDGKVLGEMNSQLSGFTDAVRRAFTDPYPPGSPGYNEQKKQDEAARDGIDINIYNRKF